MESVGLKEWALVCEALGRGEQTIILRKGGLAEGRDGFTFRHREFFLFPTFFHEQVEKTRGSSRVLPPRRTGEMQISFFAQVERAGVITDWESAVKLDSFHILSEEVVRERFEYDGVRGIHVALLRVFRLASPWSFPDARKYGGCRSWVTLPPTARNIQMEPVLPEEEHARRAQEFQVRSEFAHPLSS